MKAIVVCIDFSDASPAVLDAAARLAAATSSPLHLVHVGAPDPAFVGYAAGPETVRDTVAHALRDEHTQLHELASSCSARGIDAHPVMVRGAFAASILEAVARLDADLVVLGSHGHSAVRDLLTGSVTASVLRKARVPVLVVPVGNGK
jgi:nucleotide-binding universal stress UspA family protein